MKKKENAHKAEKAHKIFPFLSWNSQIWANFNTFEIIIGQTGGHKFFKGWDGPHGIATVCSYHFLALGAVGFLSLGVVHLMLVSWSYLTTSKNGILHFHLNSSFVLVCMLTATPPGTSLISYQIRWILMRCLNTSSLLPKNPY